MADQQSQSNPFAEFGGTATTPANPTQPPVASPVASTSAPQSQDAAPDFSAFGGTAVPTNTPAPAGPSDEEKASQIRQMAVSGLTGMPTPNMTDADKKSFAKGKAAGAISVPVVAGATIGATEAAPVVADLAGEASEYAEYYGKQAKDVLTKLAAEHPKAALAAKAYGTWLAGHVASKLGIPLPKIVKVLADL
jgi:hypothetical protein